jgi:hypothetical protein
MGKGGYLGGNSEVRITEDGTQWAPEQEVDAPPKEERWSPTVGVETGPELHARAKIRRSFISMCAVAFRNDKLTDKEPAPPDPLRKEVRAAGGNRRWICQDPARLALFERLLKQRPERG